MLDPKHPHHSTSIQESDTHSGWGVSSTHTNIRKSKAKKILYQEAKVTVQYTILYHNMEILQYRSLITKSAKQPWQYIQKAKF